jgi:hypothetical protein
MYGGEDLSAHIAELFNSVDDRGKGYELDWIGTGNVARYQEYCFLVE